MGRFTAKRTVFIVALLLMLVFSLAFMFVQYLLPNLDSPEQTVENKDVTISYSVQTVDSITAESGDSVPSDSGREFLIVEMTIENNGYESFSTNPYWFHVIADDVEYGFDYHLVLLENWDTVDILDGETFHGTLVFQLPESSSSFTLGYEAHFTEYNIVWIKM